MPADGLAVLLRSFRLPTIAAMLPDTHDTLVKMAEDQSTDLCGLFEMLTNNWKSKMKFARSEDPTVDRAEIDFLGSLYDAKIALDELRLSIELSRLRNLSPSLVERESTKRAWQKFHQQWKQLAKTILAINS